TRALILREWSARNGGSLGQGGWAMSGRDESDREPTREEIDRTEGPVVLEFGASWCPFCRALAPKLARLLRDYPGVRHIRVEDGPGRPLGRSFRVKLWPNLVFLRDGEVIQQVARPDVEEVRDRLDAIAGATGGTDPRRVPRT